MTANDSSEEPVKKVSSSGEPTAAAAKESGKQASGSEGLARKAPAKKSAVKKSAAKKAARKQASTGEEGADMSDEGTLQAAKKTLDDLKKKKPLATTSKVTRGMARQLRERTSGLVKGAATSSTNGVRRARKATRSAAHGFVRSAIRFLESVENKIEKKPSRKNASKKVAKKKNAAKKAATKKTTSAAKKPSAKKAVTKKTAIKSTAPRKSDGKNTTAKKADDSRTAGA